MEATNPIIRDEERSRKIKNQTASKNLNLNGLS